MSRSHFAAASSSNFQLVISNALKTYEKCAKQDLLAHPLASELHVCNSHDAILTILQRQVQELEQSQSSDDRDDRWTKWLVPTVKVLYTFSTTLEERASLVLSPGKMTFVAVGVILIVAKGVRDQDILIGIFERIQSFVQRLAIYTEVPPTMEMMDGIIQIIVAVLSILGIATKEMKQGRTKKYTTKMIGRTDLEDALNRLDKLTHEQAQMAATEVQRAMDVINESRETTGEVTEQVVAVDDGVVGVDDEIAEVVDDEKEAKCSPSSNVISTALPSAQPLCPNEREQSDSPSTGQPNSNVQLIVNALADYAKTTGIDLSKNSFATAIEQSNSAEAIFELLEGREKAFKEYRDGNRKLIKCLSPAVKVIQAFSGILGEAASLIPFPPASMLFAGIDTLLDAASGVSSSYDALLDLFECLGNFLKRLEIYTRMPPTPIMTDIIIKIMIELLSVLALATKQVEQGRFKKFAQKLLGESEIEGVLQRLDRLTQDEVRMTGAQTLSVVYGLVGSMKAVMEDGKASTDGIRGDLVALHEVLNDMNKMKRDQLQRDVQHWLSPPDPSTNHNFIRKARHNGTAAWFLKSSTLTEWKARGSFLWIHGKPGAGKSTLLSSIVQDIEYMHAAGLATMAFYYFDFRDVKKQDCYGLLSSLISQLSAESDSCFDILSQLYSGHTRGIRKPDIDALKKCLTDMLSLPGQAPIYIIVDALDECPNFPGRPSAREEVLELIEELVNLKLRDVHLCVASRPEMDIRIVFEPLTSLRISLHDEKGQKEDIIAYIKYVVRSDRSMRRWKEEDKQLAIDTLSDKADGMFRWVACQVDRLCRTLPPSIRSVLNDLPKTLDETYGRSLQGIDEEKRGYAQRLFRCLTVSIRPLRVEELAEVLAVRFDEAAPPTFNPAWRPENAEEAVISVCSSLVAVVDRGGHQVVQFSHYSVKEFLTSERLATAGHLSYYHILLESAHTVLAHAALSVLLQLDDKMDRDTIGRYPLAPYAARYWVDHAQFRSVSSHIRGVMERLFDPAKSHFAAWVWQHNIDRYWIEPMSEMHPTRPEAVPLYYAALCGFSDLVERLIAIDSRDVNSRGGFYTTPLHAASVKGYLLIASLLLKNGANPNSRDNSGKTPLHRVSQGGQPVMSESSLEIARLLVNSVSNVNVTDDEGSTPLHAAARSGYRDIAELLLGSGASLEVRDKKQGTPLHTACANGKLEVSRFLIDRGSDMNCQNNNGYNPLLTASGFGHVDVVRLLLDRGSDVNVRRETTRSTPLHFASWHGHLDTARLLIDRNADVNAHAAERKTPLHFASDGGHLDIAKLLAGRGAIVDSQNSKEETPLHHAAASGHLDIMRFLIESGAAVSARDNKGCTPFHTASKSGHLHITKFLLECGIDVDIRNRDGETSLDLASSSGKLDVVRFLIERGADIHTKDNNGRNPLHIASQNGHLNVVQMLINTGVAVDIQNGTQKTPLALASSKGKVQVGRFLVEHGAEINAQDSQGWAPLHFASRHGHLDMTRQLLDHGVDPNVQCGDLWSALHLASTHNHLDIAELLVQRGAAVDVLNERQETPLYQAVKNGQIAIVRLLVDQGANVHSADGNGWTALHAASHSGHLEVVKLLLRRGANIDILTKVNKSAAELASENDQAEVARFIAEYKADANIRNQIRSTTMDTGQYSVDGDGKDGGKASLHAAAEEGKIDVVKLLLNRGVDINGRTPAGKTPLDRAAFSGKVDVVRLLIERGAEVDSRDKRGWTPLHLASRYGHLELSQVLLDHGANVNARKDNHWTPIHLSAGSGHLEIVKLLLERGADGVHALDEEGRTPYQVSLAFGYREIADLLREHGARRESPQ